MQFGQTALDNIGKEKRDYESKADKIKVNAWKDFDEFDNPIETTKEFEEKVGSKILDKAIQNWLKVTNSEWRWLDPKIYGEDIKNSSEVFIYMGLKPMDEAIKDLKDEIRNYIQAPNLIFNSKDELTKHPKILIMSHFLSKKYFDLLNGIKFISVWSETDFENLKNINSIWCELEDDDSCVVLDIDTGDLFLYMCEEKYAKQKLDIVKKKLNIKDIKMITDFDRDKVFYVKFANIFNLKTDEHIENLQKKVNSILN